LLQKLRSEWTALVNDRAFFRQTLSITLPVLIQNSVSNSVNLLDNIMVGSLGTAQMSGVAIANQLMFIVMLCIFGAMAGPSIYGAQFYGAGDKKGFTDTFRLKLWFSMAVLLVATAVFALFGDNLFRLFLTGDGAPGEAELMLQCAHEYAPIIFAGMLPFVAVASYAGTLREAGETMLPMRASIAAVLTNLVGNWILIFGKLGMPALGVRGAAIATVLSRLVELGIILVGTHRNSKFDFLHGFYRSMRVSWKLTVAVLKKGWLLLVNEFLWSLGMSANLQLYSVRGLAVLGAQNIAGTVGNLFNMFFLSLGTASAVMTGQALGAGDMDGARRTAWRLIVVNFTQCVGIGAVMLLLSGVFPMLYNTDQQVRALASLFLRTGAILMPFFAVSHCAFFTMRAGGSTWVTFLFDSGYTWLLMIPSIYLVIHFTNLPIEIAYPLTQASAVLKTLLGLWFIKRGSWLRNIVDNAA